MNTSSFAFSIFFVLVALALCVQGTYFSLKAETEENKALEPPERISLTDAEMSNFSWLDTCPRCGKIDHHPFQPIETTGKQYSVVTEQVRLGVVERTCSSMKCGFNWYQH